VDIYGVGTRLTTAGGEGGGALGGVYKLVRIGDRPRLKITSDLTKATLPDRKRLLRAVTANGSFIQDIIALAGEQVSPGEMVYDPANPLQQKIIPADARLLDLCQVVMTEGKRTDPQRQPLAELAARSAEQLGRLPQGCLRLVNPHRYKVSITAGLQKLRLELVNEVRHQLRVSVEDATTAA
jgi:nicotinate phosphoribosyltransferase